MARIDDTQQDPVWIKLELRPDEVSLEAAIAPSQDLIRDETGVWIQRGEEPEADTRLRFVPRFEACPRCRSSLVSGETCGLCELDIRAQLFDHVEELTLRPLIDGSALRTVLKAIDQARRNGKPLLRIVHGTDGGGLARTLAWHLAERGDLRNWVIGDVLGDRVPVGRELADEWPILRWSSDWNAENQGVTWLVIEPLHVRSRRFQLLPSSPSPRLLE